MTTQETRPTFDVIVDCGNSNIKASLVQGTRLLSTIHMPSLLRFTKDSILVYGGYTLGGKSAVVGSDCEDRNDAIVVGEDSQGKLKYLPHLLAGVLSAFDRKLPVGAHIRFHVLTLSLDATKQVESAVQALTDFSVDHVQKSYTTELAQLLPEGAGCSYYTSDKFRSAKEVSVLDIGSGTMNLSLYTIENKEPRRTTFNFEGTGIRRLESELCGFIKDSTTNGQVDRRLVRFALLSNSTKLLDDYTNGTDISKQLTQAIEQWLNLPEVKRLLTKVGHVLATGGYVGTCGGGFKMTLVREAIVRSVTSNLPDEAKERLLVPEESDVLGVVGIAKVLTAEARKIQKQQSKERKQQEAIANGQPLPTRKRKAKATSEASQQQPASTPESVAGVSEVSASEQPTSSGTYEPSTIRMAETIEQPALAEATNAN